MTKIYDRILNPNVVDVRDFGAVGDGITDDTTSIQNAIDTNKVVIFEDGIYKISGEINLKNGYIASSCPFLIDSGGSVIGAEKNFNFKEPNTYNDHNEFIECNYDISSYFSSATNVGTFTSADIPFTMENGDLVIKIDYTGLFNNMTLQTRDAANSFLSQYLNNTSGSFSDLSSDIKTLFSGDGKSKTIYLKFDLTDQLTDIRSIRLLLNTNVNDQDSQFTIQEVKYGFVNDKNVRRVGSKFKIGKNYVAIRGSWDEFGTITQEFYDTDASLERMKLEVDRYLKVLPIDGIRFPIYYKNLTTTGNVYPDKMLRVKKMLDHINSYGLSAIVTLNHFFVSGFDDKIVIGTDIDTSNKRQEMADRAALVTNELQYHPSILVWELENEVNVAHTNRYSGLSFEDVRDYVHRIDKTVKRDLDGGGLYDYKTNIPTSVSYSGTKQHKYWLGSMNAGDIIDIHAYGIGLLVPYDFGKPIISTECETQSEVQSQKRYSITVSPWHQYVAKVTASYDQDVVEEIRTYNDGTYDIPEFTGRFIHPNNVTPITPDNTDITQLIYTDGSGTVIV